MADQRRGLPKTKSLETMPYGYLDRDKGGCDVISQPKNGLADHPSEGKLMLPLMPIMTSTQPSNSFHSRHRTIRFWNCVGLFGTLILSLLLVIISRFSFPLGRINSHIGLQGHAVNETIFSHGLANLNSDKKPSYNTEAVRFDNYSLFINGQRVFLQ
jgi:hypothetical protein